MGRTYINLNTKDDPPVKNNEDFYFRYELILFTRGLFPGANSDVCFAISMNHKQLGWKRAQRSERWPSFARRESEATAFGGFRSLIVGTHVLIEVCYEELKKFERQEKVFVENSRHNLETPKAALKTPENSTKFAGVFNTAAMHHFNNIIQTLLPS